jgi:hypothetical protein
MMPPPIHVEQLGNIDFVFVRIIIPTTWIRER